jgi:hypothetical protein
VGVMIDLYAKREYVRGVLKFVNDDEFFQSLDFDFIDSPRAEAQSANQRLNKQGFGFGYHRDIKLGKKELAFFVEVYKITKKPKKLPDLTKDLIGQENKTYLWSWSKKTKIYSILMILPKESKQEELAKEVISFIHQYKNQK